MKESNPVGWFEIYVNDISRAKKFYEKVLDIQLSDLPKPSTLTYELKMAVFPTLMQTQRKLLRIQLFVQNRDR